MLSRLQLLAFVSVVLAVGLWIAHAARGQADNQTKQKKRQKNAAQKKGEQIQRGTPVVIDESQWPRGDTITVRIELGLKDTAPQQWNGRMEVTGSKILRMRAWRFGPGMKIDELAHSWTCSSWLGPAPLNRTFDRHLPIVPQAFLRPGILIDFTVEEFANGTLTAETPHGRFSVGLASLLRSGRRSVLDGHVAVELSVFGVPVAARSRADQQIWYDDPSLAVKQGNLGEVAVSYLAYSQETTSDAVYVRRRVEGKWKEPQLISEPKGDHYRSAVCYDTTGSLWIVYSAQIDGNWDLYSRRLIDNQWQPVVRLTEAPQPDIQHVLVADSDGGLWLVWQGFRNGQSDILARRWTGESWRAEQRVSTSDANDWHPAATITTQNGLAIAWDSYAQGNYDVYCRVLENPGASWGDVIQVTQAGTLEARPTIAADGAGRLWIAYDEAGEYWGKDTGFMLEMAQAPQGTRLYAGRSIAVAVVEPKARRVRRPSQAVVQFDSLNGSLQEQLEYPQLLSDSSGRMWLVMRRLAMLSSSRRGVGRMFAWEVLVSRFNTETGKWTEPMIAADSLGRLDSLSGIGTDGKTLWVAWSTDHREYSTNRPDVSSIFAGHLPLADMPVDDAAAAHLQEVSSSAAKVRPSIPPAHPNEAADVARLRQHVIKQGNKSYHIYRGDMHRHTETSSDGGGDGSMLDTYRYALDAAAMDFLLVTDHHDGGREYDWWRREKFNDLFRVGEAFVGLFGYERSLSYPNGHRNVFFEKRGTRPLANLPQEAGRDPIGSGKFLYPHLRDRGGICFSHTSATGMGTDWRDNDPELEPLVEIFQGDRTNYEKLGAPWSADPNDPGTQEGGFQPLGYVNLALAKGYKLGFQSSSDHLSTHLSYSCILAERNTRESLMDAMKKRHAYAATDNILLDVQSEGVDGQHIMGDIFTCKGSPKIQVRVVGTAPLADIVLVKDDQVVYSTQPTRDDVAFEFTDMEAKSGTESYYYVRVTQNDRRIAWSSPMWITVDK